MNIVLIGATGNLGSKMLDEALSRHHQVTAITRNASAQAPRDHVRWVACNLEQVDALAGQLKGADAVVVSVDWAKTDVEKVFDACRKAGVKRVLVVGGAASLEVSPGVRLFDTPDFPAFLKPIVGPAAEGLKRVRQIQDLDWTFVSPSMTIAPGERTGKFRIGGDQLLTAENGESRISQEDFAVAIVDEVENPKHIRKRFTVGY